MHTVFVMLRGFYDVITGVKSLAGYLIAGNDAILYPN